MTRSAIAAIALASIAVSGCDDVALDPNPAVPSLDPTEVNFGNVQLGQSIERTVFIQNKGASNLVVESVTRGPRFEQGFDFQFDDQDSVIVPNGQRPITVTFTPTELGPRAGALVIRTNVRDENGDKIVLELPLQAVGVTSSVVVDPSVISFGNVVVDTTKTREVALRNESDTDALVEIREMEGVRLCNDRDAIGEFCLRFPERPIGPDGTFELRSRESTTLEVQFAPTLAGPTQRGAFVLRGCSSEACDVPVRVDGVGVESGFRCNPSALDFGQVNPGSCSTRTVSCENIANELVTVIAWGPADDTSTDYSFEPQRGRRCQRRRQHRRRRDLLSNHLGRGRRGAGDRNEQPVDPLHRGSADGHGGRSRH